MNIFIFLVLIFTFFTSYILVPAINRFGIKYKILDNPNKRKSHKKPTVRLGGVAIFISLYLSVFICYLFNLLSPSYFNFLKIYIIGSILFFIIGVLEDFFDISNLKKLILQFIVASFIWLQGLRLEYINFPFIKNLNLFDTYPIISLLITVFWIVGIVNAFNWLDGLDGLACGSSIIFCSGYFLFFISTGNLSDLMIIGIFITSSFGFLIHNFYPAKIFMGDSGSYLVGSIIAFFSIRSEILISSQNPNYVSFLAQFIILFLPIFDMTLVILIRILKGKSPFNADRHHLHHRLIDLGLSHKNTVLFFYFMNIISCVIGTNFMNLQI